MDMDEIRMILAVRALRKLLNKGERSDGGELVATYRALSRKQADDTKESRPRRRISSRGRSRGVSPAGT